LRRRYGKPPINQAICEFRFKGPSQWDWTVPGLVYQEIKSEFPDKRQEQTFEIKVVPIPGRVEQSVGSPTKIQFLRADNSAMVQVGPDLLTINVYPPYPGWENFQALIRQQFQIYTRIAKPGEFQRIGLRYINKILFPNAIIETTEFFLYYPHLPHEVEQTHGPFEMSVMHLYENGRDVLTLRMKTIASDGPDTSAIGLDLDYYLAAPSNIKLADGLEWVEKAHTRVDTMFEACITDKTRNLFECNGELK